MPYSALGACTSMEFTSPFFSRGWAFKGLGYAWGSFTNALKYTPKTSINYPNYGCEFIDDAFTISPKPYSMQFARTEFGETWRQTTTNVAKIMQSAKIEGIKTPIEIYEYGGTNYVINGHHRLHSAFRLGETFYIKRIPFPSSYGYSSPFQIQINAARAADIPFKVDGRMLNNILNGSK